MPLFFPNSIIRSVQFVSAEMSAGASPLDVTINPVNTDYAVALPASTWWSYTSWNMAESYEFTDYYPSLISSTTCRFTYNDLYYQIHYNRKMAAVIVEFYPHAIKSIQIISKTVGNTTTIETSTINAVNVNKTIVLPLTVMTASRRTNVNIYYWFGVISFGLTSSTAVEWDVDIIAYNHNQVRPFYAVVIEFR